MATAQLERWPAWMWVSMTFFRKSDYLYHFANHVPIAFGRKTVVF
jgi:hypothetical protein